MEYIFVVLFFISGVIAYFISKRNISIRGMLLLNSILLFINFCLLFLPAESDFIFDLYLIFLLLTISGIIMRLITPITLNLINRFFSKILHKKYYRQTYFELLNEGHRLFFCVLTFNTLKIFLQLLIFMTCFFDY